MRTAVIAALPRELAGLTRGWTRLASTTSGAMVFERGLSVAVCAGMGCDRVSKAVGMALAWGQVERLVSIGLAGACVAGLQAGEVLRARTVVDVRTGERFEGDGSEAALLATVGSIAGAAEKRRLVESYGAVMVDMEAACVARLAEAHGLRFAAIKAISDASGVSLDGMERFATADGRFREMAFARHVAVRPHRWRGAMQLGRDSARALRALTAAVLEDLERQG